MLNTCLVLTINGMQLGKDEGVANVKNWGGHWGKPQKPWLSRMFTPKASEQHLMSVEGLI